MSSITPKSQKMYSVPYTWIVVAAIFVMFIAASEWIAAGYVAKIQSPRILGPLDLSLAGRRTEAQAAMRGVGQRVRALAARGNAALNQRQPVSIRDGIMQNASRQLQKAIRTGIIPVDNPDAWARPLLVKPARREPLPASWPASAVKCTGELSHVTWRKTCVYENLYFINNTYVFAVGEGVPTVSDADFRSAYLVMSQDRPVNNVNSKPPFTFIPRRLTLKEVASGLPEDRTEISNINGTCILHNRFYVAAAGHHVWNDLFAMFTALSDVGMGEADVDPITLSLTHRDLKELRKIEESFLGGTFRSTAEWARQNKTVFIRQAVVGTGQGGADDVQQLRRFLQGHAYTRRAFWMFRNRMMVRHGHDPGPLRTVSSGDRNPKRPLKVVVVKNKRQDLHISEIVACLRHEAENRQFTVEYLDFSPASGTGNGVFGLPNLLGLLSDTDIFVSGVGTAMMWAPFIASGGVIVNLEWILGLRPGKRPLTTPSRYVISSLHSMDHMMADHFRVLYYDSAERWNGILPARTREMVTEAAAMIRGGYSLPVPIMENADMAGAAFLDLCLSNVTICQKILRSATAERGVDCSWRRYADYIMYQDRCWYGDQPGAKFAGMNEPAFLSHHLALLDQLKTASTWQEAGLQLPQGSPTADSCYPANSLSKRNQ